MVYKIKANYGYYKNTYNVPKDGFLKSEPKSENDNGKIIEFNSIEECTDCVKEIDERYKLSSNFEYRLVLEQGESYYLNHGQYARPWFKIYCYK